MKGYAAFSYVNNSITLKNFDYVVYYKDGRFAINKIEYRKFCT